VGAGGGGTRIDTNLHERESSGGLGSDNTGVLTSVRHVWGVITRGLGAGIGAAIEIILWGGCVYFITG
jgi:hypothetical protein